jgi:prepilin-type N-terminal cleavage/methylation domain-containing protein
MTEVYDRAPEVLMRKSNGFTLIELMIAIALFAIIASLAVPSFLHQRRETLLRDAVSTIRGDFEMARSRAIRENAPVAVLLREDGYSIFIDNGSGGGITENWVRDGGERQLCNRNLPSGLKIDLSQVTFDSKRTRFNGRGYVGNGGVLVLADAEGKSVTLDMNNRFGRISAY